MMDENQLESKLGGKDKNKKEAEEDDEEEKMEDDGDDKDESDPIKSIKAFKKLVIKTLEDNHMHEKRACKMEIIDFLNLLKIFNEQGIHFK